MDRIAPPFPHGRQKQQQGGGNERLSGSRRQPGRARHGDFGDPRHSQFLINWGLRQLVEYGYAIFCFIFNQDRGQREFLTAQH